MNKRKKNYINNLFKFKDNWSYLVAEGFTKNSENSNIVIENMGKLNIELCKVEVDEIDWLEISCVKK